MKNENINKTANKLVNAFLRNKLIKTLPSKYTVKLSEANKFRKLCESKISRPIIGFKAGGTGIPLLKKLKEREPFYASIYKHNFLKSNSNVKINNFVLGIELEVCFLIKRDFFTFKKKITKTNLKRFILKVAPCIEIVGYRQKKNKIKSLGDLSSDFGGNIKFVIGKKKDLSKINTNNLKTSITNKKINYLINGNTNTVYINPLNSLKFVLNKLKNDKVFLDKNFYVFTGSTVGVAPISGKGNYYGFVEKLGSVKVNII
tara:strand:- start:1310 stop:2086 length:777 start_codon:yes stop_codon:yes gene_type:complete